ncbi:MAG: PKD domain-containing protein [Bacteroidia bacterium]
MRLIPISIPSGLTERSTIVSGAITPQDESSGFLDYGVIFTTSTSPSPEDFDTRQLIGAIVENTELPPEDEDRYFTVIGGYYFERIRVNNQKEAKTTKVFGIALDREKGFFIEEDGSVILRDHWQLLEEKRSLDATNERTAGEKTGWTLIVAEAKLPRNKYPMSGKPMQVFLPCAELTGLDIVREDLNENSLSVDFQAQTDGGAIVSYVWKVGENGEAQTTKTPDFSFTFPRSEEKESEVEISVRAKGAGAGCESEASVSVKIPPAVKQPPVACPAITAINHSEAGKDNSTYTISFVADTSAAPDRFVWNFGDGSKESTSKTGAISHTFTRPEGDSQTLDVSLSIEGPGECRDETSVSVVIPPAVQKPACPAFTSITFETEEIETQALAFTFTVHFDGPAPAQFIWETGIRGESFSTREPVFTHIYKQPGGKPEKRKISVIMEGPGECSDSGELEFVLPGICPILSGISFDLLSGAGSAHQDVQFRAMVEGPAAEVYIWNFGDGKPALTTDSGMPVHRYEKKGGMPSKYKVSVVAQGPGECHAETSVECEIPGICPHLTEIRQTPGVQHIDTQEVTFTVIADGPAPESFEWIFGDESEPLISTEATVSHVYSRPSAKPSLLQVQVSAKGPGECFAVLRDYVEIPGTCPAIDEIVVGADPQEEKSQKITFTAQTRGPQPETYTWDISDGTERIVMKSPVLEHVFNRPAGKAREYEVKLTINGPGNCIDGKKVFVTIEGRCPVITEVMVENVSADARTFTCLFTALGNDLKSDQYKWNFGDGTPEENTAQPQIRHTFNRPIGRSASRKVVVSGSGPDSCAVSASVMVEVPFVCPELDQILINTKPPGANGMEVGFEVKMNLPEPAPQFYVWDFGDGSKPVTTVLPKVNHLFPRPEGDTGKYLVKVSVTGPETCSSSGEVSIYVPGVCPVMSDIQVVTNLRNDALEVTLKPVVSGPSPDGYKVKWGDGYSRPEVLVQPPFVNVYPRPSGDDITRKIEVFSFGPGQCRASREIEVTIPAQCPVITNVRQSVKAQDLLKHTIQLELTLEGPLPEKFIWEWMDGSPAEETTTPVHAHTFDRLAGRDQELLVNVRLQGPGKCTYSEPVLLTIPGSCPKIVNIQKEIVVADAATQTWKMKAVTTGHVPDAFVWNWGDGSKPEITPGNEVNHVFTRKPGDDKTRVVSVTAKGAGGCETMAETTVEIPGICPKLRKLTLTAGKLEKNSQTVSAAVMVEGPAPETFFWNWGDGSEISSTSAPTASHVYERKPGDDKIYSVIVSAKGPEGCQSGVSADMEIPGVCPSIVKIVPTTENPEAEYQEIQFEVILDGPLPGQITWDWGDGTALTRTAGTKAVHRYRRLPGDAVDYPVQVMPEGPESCRCEAMISVSVPGICPELKEVKTTLIQTTRTHQQIRATAIATAAKPDAYLWNWGDGSAVEETTSPESQHEYLRPEGDDKVFALSVSTRGPGSCIQTKSVDISVEGVCPVVQKINQKQTVEKLTQKVIFSLVMEGPKPVSFVWNWGDGTKSITTAVPEAEHIFQRPMGDDIFVETVVTVQGPGKKCSTSASARIKVLGVCPMVEDMKVETVTSARLYEEVRVTLTIDGPKPEKIRFDWGDRSEPLIHEELSAVHRYVRVPGEDKKYYITARLKGPGGCENEDETSVNIAALCPVVETIQAEPVEPAILRKTFQFDVVIDGPEPAFFEWNWGDGTPPEKTSHPYARHSYTRSFGEDANYQVAVNCLGPGKCRVSGQTAVMVEGVCPSVVSLSAEPLPPAGPDQSVWFTVQCAEGPVPESYQWNWGDGTSDESAVARVKHTFKRPYGENKDFTVSVTALGPKTCQSVASTVATVQGWCPENIKLHHSRKSLSSGIQEMLFTAETDGPPPAIYLWEFGDGSPVQETRVPQIVYPYRRLPGDDRNYEVSVTVKGPGPCSISADGVVKVEGVCPAIQSIDHQLIPSSDEKQQVRVWVEVTGPVEGGEYHWEWGNGKSSVTTAPEATGEYARKYGSDQQFLVSVALKGPQSCACNAVTQVYVPGMCPKLIYLGTDFGEYNRQYQDVTVNFDIEGEAPESYGWYWGDGQTFGADGLIGTHRYKRPLQDTDYPVKIVCNGPGYCGEEQCVVIQIEGSCPKITRLMVSYCGDSTEGQEVRVFAQTRRPGEYTYEWNWGDGSRIEKTHEPVAKHFYKFAHGKPIDYAVSVTVSGEVRQHEEDGCEDIPCSHTEKTTVHIAGHCPVIVSVRPVLGKADRTSQKIRLIAVTRGAQPARYTWDWGDASPRETTSVPYAEHLFRKDHDGPRTYSVRVIAWGPASAKGGKECQAQYEVLIRLEGEEVKIDC